MLAKRDIFAMQSRPFSFGATAMNESTNIIPTSGDAEKDRQALIDGKSVWIGEHESGDIAIRIIYDETDGYFCYQSIRWGAEGAINCADEPQLQYGGKQWVDDTALDWDDGGKFVEFWKAAKRFLNV